MDWFSYWTGSGLLRRVAFLVGERSLQMSDEVTSGYAKRLERCRVDSGKTIEEMASLIGVTFESYRDLEFHDDEIIESISLSQLDLLGKALKIDLVDFFAAGAPFPGSVSLPQLARAIEEYLDRHHKTLSEFEDLVGWEIGNALKEPKEFLGFNVTALMDICRELGLDWLSVLASISEQSRQRNDELGLSR